MVTNLWNKSSNFGRNHLREILGTSNILNNFEIAGAFSANKSTKKQVNISIKIIKNTDTVVSPSNALNISDGQFLDNIT